MQKIKALFTRLSWQLEELQQQITTIQTQLAQYQEHIKNLEKTLENNGTRDTHIHPEKEMSRLSFTLKTQGECDQIMGQYREESMELSRLLDKQIRLKTELRLLEKFQTTQQEKSRVDTIEQENRALDEWALQSGKLP